MGWPGEKHGGGGGAEKKWGLKDGVPKIGSDKWVLTSGIKGKQGLFYIG